MGKASAFTMSTLDFFRYPTVPFPKACSPPGVSAFPASPSCAHTTVIKWALLSSPRCCFYKHSVMKGPHPFSCRGETVGEILQWVGCYRTTTHSQQLLSGSCGNFQILFLSSSVGGDDEGAFEVGLTSSE